MAASCVWRCSDSPASTQKHTQLSYNAARWWVMWPAATNQRDRQRHLTHLQRKYSANHLFKSSWPQQMRKRRRKTQFCSLLSLLFFWDSNLICVMRIEQPRPWDPGLSPPCDPNLKPSKRGKSCPSEPVWSGPPSHTGMEKYADTPGRLETGFHVFPLTFSCL